MEYLRRINYSSYMTLIKLDYIFNRGDNQARYRLKQLKKINNDHIYFNGFYPYKVLQIYKRYSKCHCILRNNNFVFHNDSGPAWIGYFDNMKKVVYYKYGKIHRDIRDGPAVLVYNNDNLIMSKYYINNECIINR